MRSYPLQAWFRCATAASVVSLVVLVTSVSLLGDEPKRGSDDERGNTAARAADKSPTFDRVKSSDGTESPPVDQVGAGNSELSSLTGDRFQREQPVVKIDRLKVELLAADPVNVGVIELEYVDGHGPTIYPDQPLFLESTDGRAHYTTFDVSYQAMKDAAPWQVDQLRVAFLLRGDEPTELTLSTANGRLVDSQQAKVVNDPIRHRKVLGQWWEDFSTVPEHLDAEQKRLKESLLDILSRRLRMPSPWPKLAKNNDQEAFSLESQFERAIGMLFGIESVKLAMQEDATLTQASWRESASTSVPNPRQWRSIRVPDYPASTWIEPIAMHVPAECFYLRTGNLSNYRYFREFLIGWGGNLDDIVATKSLDRQTRKKVEGQLGLDSEAIAAVEFDSLVSDMAVIGSDPLFENGAGVGLLFRARDPKGLYDVLKDQRNQAQDRVPASTEGRVNLAGHAVSLLSSDDNRLRSFYAIDGEYHLVSNSQKLVERFFEAGSGDRSLGRLKEFGYARSKTSGHRDTIAFLYLSDPFFQNLISPHYRIEVTRRKRAARELRQLQLARLIARTERADAVSNEELVKARLLPPGFARRPDGSVPVVGEGMAKDSLRGAIGYFLPVPDVQVNAATPSELSSYRAFESRYNAEWRRIDPVTVIFSRDGASEQDRTEQDPAKQDLQRVGLQIMVTPYAKQKYALLERHLAPPSQRRVTPNPGDLLSVDTAVRVRPGAQPHLLYLGLRDDDIGFTMKDGEVELVDETKGSSFAKSRTYAAISPPSTDILRLLSQVLLNQTLPSNPTPAPSRRQTRPIPPPSVPMPAVGHALYYFGFAFGNLAPKVAAATKYSELVDTRGVWTVVSTDKALRQDAFDTLDEQWAGELSQVRLRMGSLSGSKVEPYIQAYTYSAARRVSVENTQFLNDFGRWLQLPPEQTRDAVEELLGASLHCPLGGDYQVQQSDGHTRWVGTSWPEASLYAETATPESWKHPFLDWVRSLDLQFDIDGTTLEAKADLLIRRSVEQGDEIRLVALPMVASEKASPENAGSEKAASRGKASGSLFNMSGESSADREGIRDDHPDNALSATQGDSRRSRGDWVLGVRVVVEGQTTRIVHVYPDSPAERIGIRIGDLIRSIDSQTPRSHEQLVQMLESGRRRGRAQIRVDRDGSSVTFDVTLSQR